MPIGTINLWEDCNDCDTIEGLKDHLQSVLRDLPNIIQPNERFSTKEACEYLKIKSVKTLHNLTSMGEIAYSKPNGKFKYFKKADLDEFMDRNRHRTKYMIS